MRFKEVLSWLADDKPETTRAIVVVSDCGTIVKRLPYRNWNKANNGYANMKEHVYALSSNRGKQRFDSEEKIKSHGKYLHVTINGKIHSVHRLVAKAWVENPEDLPCVNHINGIRDDNRKENLEWVSNKDNVAHAWETGLRCTSRMKRMPDSDLPSAMEMRRSGLSNPKIGKHFGVTGETIRLRLKEYEDSIRSKK